MACDKRVARLRPSFRLVCAEKVAAIIVAFFWALPVVVQAQFTYTTNNSTVTITGYTGTNDDVSIPNTINGLPVTTILSCQFSYSSGVTNVMIPDSVTNIGFGAFELFSFPFAPLPDGRLTAITVDTNNPIYSSVDGVLLNKITGTLIQYPCGKAESSYTVPNSVNNIANNAFYYCVSLANITIPDSVTNIGVNAFQWCSSLTDVTIGNGVTSIGNYAFQWCSSLTDATIGNGVASIGNYAFEGTGLIGVTIPNSVTNIGVAAFQSSSLTSVMIGTNVTNIGNNAFENTSLTSVAIPNSVTNLGSQVFYDCRSLTNVSIGYGVTSIGAEIFNDCSSLTTLTIPGNVTNIGDDPFVGCSSLTGIYFLGNVPNIGIMHFVHENNATVYYLPGTIGWGATFGGSPAMLWLPQMQTGDSSFGVRTNQFGFNINWASDRIVVVEASPNLTNPNWSPLWTNTLTSGSSYFSDSQWTNHPSRFYRIRSP